MLELARDRIDINQPNKKDGSTIYGTLFYNNSLPHYKEEGYKADEKLDLLH